MDRPLLGKLAVALLLMVFVFSLTNLVYNIENLHLSGELEPTVNRVQTVYNVSASNTTTTILKYMFYSIPVIMVIGTVLGAYTFITSKDKKKWKRMMIQIAGILLIFLIVFAFGFFYTDIESSLSNSGITAPIGGGSGATGGGGNGTANATNPSGVRVIMTFAIFAIGFSAVLLAVVGTIAISRMRATRLKYDKSAQAKEMAETIQRALDTVYTGSDVRSTVMRCYTEMCKVMAKHGVTEEQHLTPREFEVLIKGSLDISETHLHELVTVFEEARYSDHAMSDADSQRALRSLEKVKGELLAQAEKVPGTGPGDVDV
jgi:hypothetical protein